MGLASRKGTSFSESELLFTYGHRRGNPASVSILFFLFFTQPHYLLKGNTER